MKKFKRGLIIGRFQPFHKGHSYLINEALKFCDNIIIAIGSTNIKDMNNPWNFKARKKMLDDFIEKENLIGRVIKIIPSQDIPDDDKWFEATVKDAGLFDAVIGNNDWVNGIFKRYRFTVISIPYYKRRILEGYKIRNLMRSRKKWQSRVPSYIVDKLKQIDKQG